MVITRDNTLQIWKARAVAAFQFCWLYAICFAGVFLFVSANFAWTNEPFDLGFAMWVAGIGSIPPVIGLYQPKWLADMPLLYSKPKKLIQKKARLAQKWDELQDEAEQMKTLRRLENED